MIKGYLEGMTARFLIMLAVFAITVVTTVTPSHAARMSMSSSADHETHVREMMHSPELSDFACDAGQHCGSVDAEICEFVCAGLLVFLTSPGGETRHVHGSASHGFLSEAIHVSRVPGLNERPPKLRLL